MRKFSKMGRYIHNKKGKVIKVADIYSSQEYSIDSRQIDERVFQIAHQLQTHGYNAFLVGGAVRDLLLGKQPKDFDIVTDAHPSEIRFVIKNSRIIGKRFRLVHVFYPGGKIIEVITFRSINSEAHKPEYGTIEEDVQRRDFTINALYYDLNKQHIIDFIGAMADFRKRQMRNIISLHQIFKEDPVRIIRCIKYAAQTGFKIPKKLILQLKRDCKLLYDCSKSRLAEELSKILGSEYSPQILGELRQYNILAILLPCLEDKNFPNAYQLDFSNYMFAWRQCLQNHNQIQAEIEERQKNLSQSRRKKKKHETNSTEIEGHLGKNFLGVGFSYLFSAYFTYSGQWERLLELINSEERSLEAYLHIKLCLNKLNIPNIEILTACKYLFEREGLTFEPRLILKKYGRSNSSLFGNRYRKSAQNRHHREKHNHKTGHKKQNTDE